MGGHEQGTLTQLRFTTDARSVPPFAREVLKVGHLSEEVTGSRRYFGRALRITARMYIAALWAARATRRCVAPLRHMAPRPLRPRGHVTYAPPLCEIYANED